MNLPMFTWSCVVALIMIFMICKVILFVRVKAAKKDLFEVGNEYDEFYVPGDSLEDDD